MQELSQLREFLFLYFEFQAEGIRGKKCYMDLPSNVASENMTLKLIALSV